MKKVFWLLVLIACLGSSTRLGATHLAGFDIQYTCIDPVNDIYEVTLRLYTDGCGIAPPGSITMWYMSDFGQFQATFNASTTINVTPICLSFQNQTCCGGGLISCFLQTSYIGNIDLTGCDYWTMYVEDCCRNNAINNLVNPGAAGIYIETVYNTAQSHPYNTSVILDRQPIIFSCVNQQIYYSPLAHDAEGDSLSFRFVNPRMPLHGVIPFVAPYTLTRPFPLDTLIMNEHTGVITFTPSTPGNYVIGIAVDEYRNGVLIGTTFRDMQILILPPNLCLQISQPPVIVIDNVAGGTHELDMYESDFWVCPGNDLSFSFEVTDPDFDSLTFYTDLINQPNINFVFTQNLAGDTITGHATINTSDYLFGESHTFHMVIGDTSCPVNNSLVRYFTIRATDLHAHSNIGEVCLGNDNELHLSTNLAGNYNLPATYSWNPTNDLDDSFSPNPIAHIFSPTTFFVNYQSGTCSLQDSVMIGASPGSLVFPSDSIAAFVCIGDSVQLSPQSGLPPIVSFTNMDSAAVVPGTYTDFPIPVHGLLMNLVPGQLSSICIDVATQITGQVEIFLISPDGTQIPLSTGNGGFGNEGYRNTCFDQLAGISITAYVFTPIPVNAIVRPEWPGDLNNFNGHLANGTWYLRVEGAVNNGTAIMFRSVTMTFNTYANPTLHWEPQTGLTCYDCPSPTAYVTQPTTWEVHASNVYGCLDTFLYSLTPIIDTSLCDSLVVPPYWVPRDENNPVLVSTLPAETWAQPRLYPNPANQQVILEMDGPLRTGTVTFSNVMGQSLLTGSITQQRNAYDVSGLPPGIYFVNVRYADGGNWVGRLVVGR